MSEVVADDIVARPRVGRATGTNWRAVLTTLLEGRPTKILAVLLREKQPCRLPCQDNANMPQG
jgi:hypothetical protein